MARTSPHRCFQHSPNFIPPRNISQNPNNATKLFRFNQLRTFICEMNVPPCSALARTGRTGRALAGRVLDQGR